MANLEWSDFRSDRLRQGVTAFRHLARNRKYSFVSVSLLLGNLQPLVILTFIRESTFSRSHLHPPISPLPPLLCLSTYTTPSPEPKSRFKP